ncbi:MAG: N-6 DNA methylase [Elusimicrobia bacterium]|nr:N-6 DNA methylase [Elusimicrobiota bacterium]
MNNEIEIIQKLISKFDADKQILTSDTSGFTETETRIEYIDPFFECLGWDMSNKHGTPNSLKDIVREESQPNETSTKRPDYTFRIAATRKFFVEAKKPSVNIKTHKESAFQLRSYGWTAGMQVSILTNFQTLRIYNTQIAPQELDNADAGLILEIDYKDIPSKYKDLLSLFGREAVATGSLDKAYGVITVAHVNTLFLDRINNWRIQVASDLNSRYQELGLNELNDITQKVINRIIFIRMCEDRGIEGEERLRNVSKTKSYVDLKALFKELNERYNTGLFETTNDPLQNNYSIDSQIFFSIVEELYFPKSPYSFSVLNADFLGQVYELFLTKRLSFDDAKQIILEDKPLYDSREVITTPQPIVDEIVRRSFSGKLIEMRESGILNYDSLRSLRILDIAVGSGRFLLRCLDELADAALECLMKKGDFSQIYKKSEGDYRLSFVIKKELLESCLFGIDIDYNAVEVARFSLLIKLLEDENKGTLPSGKKILPNIDQNIVWGNSVVDNDFSNINRDVIESTRPLDWKTAYLPVGFDLIVGNPPYIKTEDMKVKTKYEYDYYKKKYQSPYKQFDKYYIFLERAISKLNEKGWVGMVVPNKWITIEAGNKLREMLTKNNLVAEIVDFGNELLFEGKSTYVCLLLLSKSKKDSFWYQYVRDYSVWTLTPHEKGISLDSQLLFNLRGRSWVLPASKTEALVLAKLYRNSLLLSEIVDVINGIQTSAEDIFSIEKWVERNGILNFERNNVTWEMENSITKPYLINSTSQVWSYLPIEADSRIIFPYHQNSDGEAVLIKPSDLSKKYPLAYKYFSANKERLLERDVSPPYKSDEYYCYGRHQALNVAFKSPKIIYSVNQLGDKYGIDMSGVGFASGGTAGEVALINPKSGYSLEFILGLLNQRVVEYFLRKRGSSFRGGYFSRGSAVISDLPVPKLNFSNENHLKSHERITKLVKSIIEIQKNIRSSVGREIEQLSAKKIQLMTELKSEYNSIWDFHEEDDKLILPGE